jgi:hypothetical protein
VCFSLSLFFALPMSLFQEYFWKDRSHQTWSFVFMEWMDDTMLTSSVEA